MKKILFPLGLFCIIMIIGCNSERVKDKTGLNPERPKLQLTAYSEDFEVFAEADPFVIGKSSNVLSHITFLSDFKPIENGSVIMRLKIGETEVNHSLEQPTRKGIYSFDVSPKVVGEGQIIYDITANKKQYQIVIPNVKVYQYEMTADSMATSSAATRTNAVGFTKEQSWKIDFSTELPQVQPFGQVIKTTAHVQPAQGDEITLSALTPGIVMLTKGMLLEGQKVEKDKILLTISGSGLADNNASVRFADAKNSYEKTKADYERLTELVKDKIVSEKEFLKARTDYENARSVYENLSKNFNSTGQDVMSPMDGFINRLYVQNGQFVETGQSLISIVQNKTLLLRAEIQQKHAAILGSVLTANIRTPEDNRIYSLEKLKGQVLSFGKSANADNYLIPVSLLIENNGKFTVGSFVDLFLLIGSERDALTVPNTGIMEDQGNYFVFVQKNPELFEKREVRIGATDGINTEILSGINKDERIVSRGAIIVKLSQSTGALDAQSGHVH